MHVCHYTVSILFSAVFEPGLIVVNQCTRELVRHGDRLSQIGNNKGSRSGQVELVKIAPKKAETLMRLLWCCCRFPGGFTLTGISVSALAYLVKQNELKAAHLKTTKKQGF